ncbi:MAG: flavodoxin family protein [Proteobacteria bacterium]|nr:flavodoxin family protein [Pseudomonadota bacterium]
MKIVGFVGSPRKRGNTDIMVDTFLEGAESGGALVMKFNLADLDINQCQGCFRNCMMRPEITCPRFDDDMAALIEEMITSDVMLFASPLYCGSYTAIMARFFERCLPLIEIEIVGKEGTKEGFRWVSNPVRGKKAVIGLVQDMIYPGVGDLALEVFKRNVRKTYKIDIVETIHVVDVRDKGDIQKKEQRLIEIFEIGKRIAVESSP